MSSSAALASITLAWLVFQSMPHSCQGAPQLLYAYDPELGILIPLTSPLAPLGDTSGTRETGQSSNSGFFHANSPSARQYPGAVQDSPPDARSQLSQVGLNGPVDEHPTQFRSGRETWDAQRRGNSWQGNNGINTRTAVLLVPIGSQKETWNADTGKFDVDATTTVTLMQPAVSLTIGSASGSTMPDPNSQMSAAGSQAESQPIGNGPGGPWDLSYISDPSHMMSYNPSGPGDSADQLSLQLRMSNQAPMQQGPDGQWSSEMSQGLIKVNAPPGTTLTVQQGGSPQQVAADMDGSFNDVGMDPQPWSSSSNNVNITESPTQRLEACLTSCVNHGHCDGATQQCVCETFWTTNPFVSTVRPYRPNCNWNIFVVTGALIGILFGLIMMSIILHCCCKRCCLREPKQMDRRYKLVPDEGYGKARKELLIKRSRMVDSDEDEDEDEAVFEARNPQFYGSTPNAHGEASKGTKKIIP